MRPLLVIITAFVLFTVNVTPSAFAANAEKRIAFVVGNETYAAGALPTAANDAGLVAQTLQAAGFDVIGARNLDAETLRLSYADFLKRVTDAGPDTVAFIYLAGYGLQYGNDDYYVPIGANVSRDLDIPIEAVRLSDLTGPLNGLNLKARFTVFDVAYKPPFRTSGPPLAGGLALIDASPGSLVAYNAAPGSVALPAKGNYGRYAQSLAAILREGGLAPDEIFERVRLRVDEQSKGAEVPWDSSKIDVAFRFFDRGKTAPPSSATAEQVAALRTKPIKDLPAKQAYTVAVARDTIESYSDFDAAYGRDPLGKRVRVLLAVRREAITWRRTVAVDTPDAYWSYLGRYSRGPHAGAARLRLEALSAALAPPKSFQPITYDVPSPPPDEVVYVERPVVSFDDPSYDLPPPPPVPDYWLPPVPVAFVDLPPPPPPFGLFFLPVPAFVPLPDYDNPPPFVAYPVDNYFYGGFGGRAFERGRDVFINNTSVINNIHRAFPAGGPNGIHGGAGVRPSGVALPGAARQRAAVLERRGVATPAQLNAARRQPGRLNGGAAGPGGPGERGALPADQRLPGENGKPLPATHAGKPAADARGGAGARGAANSRPNERRGTNVRPNEAGRRGQASRAGATDARRHAANANRQKADKGRQGRRQRQGGSRQRQDGARRREGAGRHRQDAGGTRQNAGRHRQDVNRQGQQGTRQRRDGARQTQGAARQQRSQQQRGQQRQQVRPQSQRVRPGNFGGDRRSGLSGGAGRPGGFDGGHRGGFGGGGRPGGFAGGGRPGGFAGGGRPGGFAGGGRPGGFAGGGRPGGFAGGGRPGGFGGGRAGGFGGGRVGGFGGGRAGGFGGGGGGGRGFGGGGGRR